MQTLFYATGLAIFLILASMLLTIPRQVGILRALDKDLQLVEECESGIGSACEELTASQDLAMRVKDGTSSMEGTCLYMTEHGLAVRAPSGHVSDVSRKASVIFV